MGESSAIVELRDVHKTFIHSHALNNLSLSVLEGESLGIVGHNGAGKSTLVNILTGTFRQTSGSIMVDGLPLGPDYDVQTANRLGIRAVFQELSLCPNLTVLENMKVFHRSLSGFGWEKQAETIIMSTLDKIFPGHGIHPKDVVENLPLGERQIVEIAKAFSEAGGRLRLVILDEPTSALDHRTSRQLIDFINSLRGGSMSVVFISHLLDEVLACTSRIAVLKDGANVGILATSTASRRTIIESMGEAKMIKEGGLEKGARAEPDGREKAAFMVEPTRDDGRLRIRVRKGEVVGLAGLAGHGQTALLHRLFDYRHGKDYRIQGPTTFIAGDRQSDGIFPVWSIAKNITVQVYDRVKNFLLIDPSKERAVADKWKAAIDIKVDSTARGILSLSGGNQQKVLFARCLESSSPLVLMDDPTRGVDVGTKDEIYELIIEESGKGRSFVWYTTEMSELKYCDRIYVFRSGEIIAELSGDKATEEDILKSSF
ncbi:MAG: sugar ABC transporter ATP-binding protein [Rectinemataceae bacterium]|jgi:ribose transport system ATP-binding protein